MPRLLISLIIASFFAVEPALADPLSEPIQSLPAGGPASNPETLKLGEDLFNDTRLSKTGTVSCSSCHNLQQGGADSLKKSVGINGSIGEINAPTVFSSGFNFRQFWNGRARTLEDQIESPIQNPKEMGSEWTDVLTKLNADSAYPRRFNSLYRDGITKENVKNAIATFERSLVTPNSRFDQFLRGDTSAISALEKLGYQRFKNFGCVACHQGVNVGGNMFQTMGVMGNYFADRGAPDSEADQGRFAVTKNQMDMHVFRVPSLRNVELTAPYFHDGSAATLGEAVSTMAKYQLGRKLSREEIDSIVGFLKTLTGQNPLRNRLKVGDRSK